MIRHALALVCTLTLTSFAPAQDKPPAQAKPAEASATAVVADKPEKKLEPEHLKALTEALGAKPGETKGKVHTITLPRTDLDLRSVEFGEVPIEAGLASTFHVWRCHCGKYFVIGQFCVIEYESNDVIDALRANAMMHIASVAPMLLQEKPRILLIRFQGEGEIDNVVKILKEAVQWIGENRTKTNPIKD